MHYVGIWLTHEINYGFDLNDYSVFILFRNSHGGGIQIFVANNIPAEIDEQSIFIDLFDYIADFTGSVFENILNNISSRTKLILCGDFNINIFHPLKHMNVDSFIHTMLGFSFTPFVTKAT